MFAFSNEAIPAGAGVQFKTELSTERTNEISFAFARALLDRLSESGWMAAGLDILAGITSNDVPYLCNLDPFILDLQAADQFHIRQCLALFSKRADVDLGVDRKDAASKKFGEAEQSCSVTNQCFRAWSQGRFQFDPFVESVLHGAQRKISDVLGHCPSLAEIRLRFGPGATTATPKKNACPVVKLEAGLTCSTNFPLSLLEEVVAGDFNPAVRNHGDEVSVGIHRSRVSFVPKNAKIDRAICVEPSLNSMIQNGIGDWVATRLRRVGIDIRDQSANQRAALYGSISGVSATLDLSSASDTVAKGLVEHLLSDEWYRLIFDVSTREGVVNGMVTVFEKISSMGNGVTFPLETLIFWALAQSVKDIVCPHHRTRVLVYGDDIIVPVDCVPGMKLVFRSLGFSLNPSKSFWEGSFRESCGCDYVLGENVRPAYIDGPLTGADLYRLSNFFHRRGDSASASFWKSHTCPYTRLYGPDGYGDGHLIDGYHPLLLRGGEYPGSFRFSTYTESPRKLATNLAKSIASRVRYRPQVWSDTKKGWVRSKVPVFGREYHSEILVRILATYTAYSYERRVLTLTESDKLRTGRGHVYADRRMPDPQTGDDEDFFVTPGAGKWYRTNIYIFGSPE